MNTLINQLKQTNEALRAYLELQLQEAAKVDAHHYTIKSIQGFNVAFREEIYMNFTVDIIAATQVATNLYALRELFSVLCKSVGYEMKYLDHHTTYANCRRYSVEIEYSPQTTTFLSLAWDDIEEVTGYAIFEIDDVPAQLTWNGIEYLLLKAEEGTADYERQIKQ